MKRNANRPHQAKALQRAFFKAAGPGVLLLKEMFDRLPNVASYIKDAEGRFMAINRLNRDRCGIASEDDVIGKRSCDLFPEGISRHIMERDRTVIETGKPIIDRREQRTAKNLAGPIVISIYPVRNLKNKIIGTVGAYYQNDVNVPIQPNSEKINDAVAYLNQHFTEPIILRDIPQKFGLTPATFYREFARKILATPSQYLTSLRIEQARKMLETTPNTITSIALTCGFFDHSHFVHTFRREQGITPGEYRRRHRESTDLGANLTSSLSSEITGLSPRDPRQ